MFCFLCVTFYIDCTLQCMFKYVNEGLREAVASKKLVTGPNGRMVAQTFCDIFFYEKKTSDINI